MTAHDVDVHGLFVVLPHDDPLAHPLIIRGSSALSAEESAYEEDKRGPGGTGSPLEQVIPSAGHSYPARQKILRCAQNDLGGGRLPGPSF